MLLFVAGLITMSCLTLSVLNADDGRDALLYQVDIFLPPKKGRDETADILHIKETVKDLSDIDVLFSFKELGNPRIILVLDVEKACSWSQLTDFLLSKGYEYRVTSLYHVSDFAQELGVNLTGDLWATSFENHRLVMDRVVFPERGLSTLEYNEMLEWTLERDAALARSGQQMTMFRALGEYPLELIYFGAVTQHRIEEYEEYLHGPRDFENVLQESKTLIITQDSAKETNPMRNAV
ncbi:uncharacterized protein LOC124145435 isoform X1 [Haliotis rufescens]|uniref:uncharacterized protein LOC124145435 isoform X1 n=1 Tax=Haliotis rufescens TaxID=6454 RepID=UPI00201F2D66|nr:uncharacterized protein LOC124145435 isoform X1 [Haliotis rufescens]